MIRLHKAHKRSIYERFLKRPFDIISSAAFLIIFSWLYLIIAVLVRINLGSPIIFKQERPGKDEKIFKIYKFRTMTDKRDKDGNLLPDDDRLTKFGRMLRSTSLDELPEIFNILKGDMSVVGCRPLFVAYLPFYTAEEHKRHDLRPGLTGWAQVNGRNTTPWDIRLQQDIYYVEHCSFMFDLRIIFLTILKVVKRSDILMGDENLKAQGRLDVARGENKKKEE